MKKARLTLSKNLAFYLLEYCKITTIYYHQTFHV